MKTRPNAVSVVQVNYVFDKELTDPDQLLDCYHTLTGWSDALRRAGAGPIAVVQRFHRDARLVRNGIDYIFCRASITAAAAASRADVAHVNGLSFPAQTWLLRRRLDPACAVVVQSHADGGAIGRAPAFRLLGRALRSAADAFLFAADEHAAAWRAAGFIAPDQPTYRVMPASATLPPFDHAQGRPFDQAQGGPIDRATARAASGVTGAPAMLWVGRLNANKDPLTVLDGFERSLRDLPGATLTMIYGEDDLLEAVRQRVQRSPALMARVRLAGAVPRDQMASRYRAADLFVVGSHHEGSGYALMEACACGVVPVVTSIPTFRLMTADGSIGALWTAGDAADCARALVDVGRRDLDGERARLADHFARELSWDAVGKRALEIYGRVLDARR